MKDRARDLRPKPTNQPVYELSRKRLLCSKEDHREKVIEIIILRKIIDNKEERSSFLRKKEKIT